MDMMDILMAKSLSGSGLPEVTTEDAGDILVVNEEGKWDKGDLPSSDLPEVTSEDNGNILKVVSGAWAKAVGDFEVIPLNAGGRKTVTLPIAVKDFRNAYAGKPNTVLLISNLDLGLGMSGQDRVALFYMDHYSTASESYLEFGNIVSNIYNNSISLYYVYLKFGSYNGSKQISVEKYQILPGGSGNVGKFLSVGNDNKYKFVNLPTELPVVTASDAGNVLMVNNEGNWVKDDLPNNSNVVMYEVKLGNGGSGLELKNATIGDLKNDFDAGKIIILKNTSGHAYADGDMYYCSGKKGGQSYSDVTFFRIVHYSLNPLKIKVDGCYFSYTTPSVTSKTLNVFSDIVGLTPNVSASDNGKILKVVDGAWSTANETTELPTVTASDAGNVLGVNSEGQWDKMAASGDVKVYHFTDNGSLGFFSDGYADEIRANVDAGKAVFLIDDKKRLFTMFSKDYSDCYGFICTTIVEVELGSYFVLYRMIRLPNRHEQYGYTNYLYPIPTVSSADNGKVLTVVNGKWNSASLPS